MPSKRKDLERTALMMKTIKNPPKKETTDVMGNPYTRTGDSTYDYIMEYGATPTKKDERKYKRGVRRGKI